MFNRISIILLVIVGGLFAGNFKFPEIDGWQREDTVAVYDASNLWERIDGAADLFLSYGFQELYAADLHKGNIGLALEIYDMGTPLNAFGIYNTEVPANKKKQKIGTEAVVSPPTQGFLLKNRYYVKLDVFEGKMSETDGMALFEAAEAVLPGDNSLPAELSMLPEKNMMPASVAYVKNGFQGLSELQNCLTAEYKTKDGKVFNYFVLVAGQNGDFLKTIGKKWQTVAYKGNKVYFREIPYKGFIGITSIKGKYIGVTDSETREQMLERLDLIR
jgi:hypothetical protein